MHGLISSGGKTYLPIDGTYENSLFEHNEHNHSVTLWRKMFGLDPFLTIDSAYDDLFECVKSGFESRFGCKLDAIFDSQFIAGNNGECSVKHDQASRAYSAGSLVYIDNLMFGVLFDYVANHYLWGALGNEVFSFCFEYTLRILDACCRQGNMNNDESVSALLNLLSTRLTRMNVKMISDLYWCIMAFIMCHELAHIYIDQVCGANGTSVSAANAEILADEYGYEVYMHLIDKKNIQFSSPYLEPFQDDVYAAPMILFLFFEDLYFMANWVYGETPKLGEHRPFSERRDRLLELSREWDFNINFETGNHVLASYWDVSDLFREELVYKLKNGKLSAIIQRGYDNMNNKSGYEQAVQYDRTVQTKLKEYAKSQNIDVGKMIGLYNIAAKYEVPDGDIPDHNLVRAKGEKVVSTKPYNLRFCLVASLSAIIDTGVALFTSDSIMLTVVQLLKILLTLWNDVTIELTEKQAYVLIECYRRNAHRVPIDETQLTDTDSTLYKTIDELCILRCIELQDGKIRLVEEIALN